MRQNVWITGASSGIGEALARVYAKQGATLILSARNQEKLNKLANELETNCFVLPLDLSQTETLESKAKEAIQKVQKINILINNGGISQRGLALETTLETERKIMEVDFFGTVSIW